MNKQSFGDALFAATIVGCLFFLLFFLYVATRLYVVFKLTGIPIHSHGEIIASVDAFWATAVISLIAVAAAVAVIWRAIRARRRFG